MFFRIFSPATMNISEDDEDIGGCPMIVSYETLHLMDETRYYWIRFSYLPQSVLSIVFFAHLINKYLSSPPFHKNLKVLLLAFSYNLMITSILRFIVEGHFWLMVVFSPCWYDWIAPIYPYMYVTVNFPEMNVIWLLTAIAFERMMATYHWQYYERIGGNLGYKILGMALFSSLFSEVLPLIPHGLPSPVLNIYSPSYSSESLVLWSRVLSSGLMAGTVVLMMVLHVANKWREQAERFSDSGRYQLRENVLTTKMSVHIILFAFLPVTLTRTLIPILRLEIDDYTGEPTAFAIVCQALSLIPLYSCIFPLQMIYLLKKMRKERQEYHRGAQEMELRAGDEYNRYLASMWENGPQ